VFDSEPQREEQEMKKFPKARRENLIVQELPDELLIYDEERDRAHCLNQTASTIWQKCDGRTSVEEITRFLSEKAKSPVPDQVVWYALQQFERNHLLAEEIAPPPALAGLNRRQMVRALGIAAVVAVPLVTSILAPVPAQAATCLGSGQSCSTAAQCCSNVCAGGNCL